MTVFESKFGFHPCDREHYKKLRKVRYYAHINWQQESALSRWERKEPQNRLKWKKIIGANEKGQLTTTWESHPWEKPEMCPVRLQLLYDDYHLALPQPNKELVRKLMLTPETVDAMIAQCEAWLIRIGRHETVHCLK